MENAELTGEWAVDVLAIAESQLGYTESTKNVILTDSGDLKGYTRYGDWYGVPYGDWCAMFVSFCLDYAGVEDFPLDSSCVSWIEKLEELEIYFTPDVYFHESEQVPVLFRLLYCCGTRINETLGVKKKDVDLDSGKESPI